MSVNVMGALWLAVLCSLAVLGWAYGAWHLARWLGAGHPCFWGHRWVRVREYDLACEGVQWECERCPARLDVARLSDRILRRVGLGRWARGKLMLYTGRPGTLHVASWLLRGAPVRVSDGYMLPRGYGIAWYVPARMESIWAPVPINWAYAAACGLWWRILVRPPWVRRLAHQEAELRAREDELRDLVARVERELQAGCHVERALERGRT